MRSLQFFAGAAAVAGAALSFATVGPPPAVAAHQGAIPKKVGRTIAVKRGIGQLLRKTPADVVALIGRPSRRIRVQGVRQLLKFDYRRRYGLEILFLETWTRGAFRSNVVIVHSKRYRTKEGVRVGSSVSDLKATYPAAADSCQPLVGSSNKDQLEHCFVKAGTRQTSFIYKNGILDEIELGIDLP